PIARTNRGESRRRRRTALWRGQPTARLHVESFPGLHKGREIMMRAHACFVLCASIGAASGAADEAQPASTRGAWTLESAIRQALGHNPSLRIAALDVERSAERVAAAKARRLPATDASAMMGTLVAPV